MLKLSFAFFGLSVHLDVLFLNLLRLDRDRDLDLECFFLSLFLSLPRSLERDLDEGFFVICSDFLGDCLRLSLDLDLVDLVI